MDWSKFLNAEAIATYLVFLFGIVVAAIGFFITRYFNRKRPKKVVVTKVKATSLIEIDEEVRDDIQVTYKGQPANSLFLSTFSVVNKGEEVIDDIHIILHLPNSQIVEAITDDALASRQCLLSNDENGHCLNLSIPYLNPENTYRDKVTLKAFAFEPIRVASVQGGGRGWVVDYADKVKLQSELADILSNVQLEVGGHPMVTIRGATDLIFKVLPRVVSLVRGM